MTLGPQDPRMAQRASFRMVASSWRTSISAVAGVGKRRSGRVSKSVLGQQGGEDRKPKGGSGVEEALPALAQPCGTAVDSDRLASDTLFRPLTCAPFTVTTHAPRQHLPFPVRLSHLCRSTPWQALESSATSVACCLCLQRISDVRMVRVLLQWFFKTPPISLTLQATTFTTPEEPQPFT